MPSLRDQVSSTEEVWPDEVPQDRYELARYHVATFPELHHLAEDGTVSTNDGLQEVPPWEASYSRFLGKTHFSPDLERALLSLRCLRLIVSGRPEDHQSFTFPQGEGRLTWEHFRDLSERWSTVADLDGPGGFLTEDLIRVAEVDSALSDLGKSPWAHGLVADLGIRDVDHDAFYDHVMSHPEAPLRFPSFRRLNERQQQLLRRAAVLVHYGHISHLEGGPGMFRPIVESGILHEDPLAFEFSTISYALDVAGARAHRNNSGSLTYDDRTHRVLESAFGACRLLKEQDEFSVYGTYLRQRAEWMGLQVRDAVDEAATRIGTMMRLDMADGGLHVRRGLDALDADVRGLAVRHLSIEGAARQAATPTYVPALLVNLLGNPALGEQRESRVVEAVRLGVRFVALALERHDTLLRNGKVDPLVPLNFNPAAGVAVREPSRLLEREPVINLATGEVSAA